MSDLLTKHIVLAGTDPGLDAAATSMTAEVGPGMFLQLHNGSGGSITVTIAVPGVGENNVAKPDTVYTVANGANLYAPLYPYYADPSDGRAHITASSATTVTCAAIKR
jgi:hypothetical protein